MKSTVLAIGCLLAIAAPLASADTLLIERVKVESSANLPKRGSSMGTVEAKFGAPQHKFAAVGGGSKQMPPITRWQYDTFSVYFENQHVVDAVLTKATPMEVGPAPVGN